MSLFSDKYVTRLIDSGLLMTSSSDLIVLDTLSWPYIKKSTFLKFRCTSFWPVCQHGQTQTELTVIDHWTNFRISMKGWCFTILSNTFFHWSFSGHRFCFKLFFFTFISYNTCNFIAILGGLWSFSEDKLYTVNPFLRLVVTRREEDVQWGDSSLSITFHFVATVSAVQYKFQSFLCSWTTFCSACLVCKFPFRLADWVVDESMWWSPFLSQRGINRSGELLRKFLHVLGQCKRLCTICYLSMAEKYFS